jgi:hypothetical protein
VAPASPNSTSGPKPLFQHVDRHLDAAGDHGLDDDTGQPAAEGPSQRAEPAPDLILAVQVEQDGARACPAHDQAGSANGSPCLT